MIAALTELSSLSQGEGRTASGDSPATKPLVLARRVAEEFTASLNPA